MTTLALYQNLTTTAAFRSVYEPATRQVRPILAELCPLFKVNLHQ